MLLLAAVGATPACSTSDECSPVEVTGEGEAAAGQASCAWQLSIDGVTYTPGCAPISHAALGDVIVDGDSMGTHIVARTIVDVPQDQAVALFTRSPYDRETRARIERRCGRWTLAPSIELDGDAVRSLARSVSAAG